MVNKIKTWYYHILFMIFIKTGSKLYSYVTVYAPGESDIKAVHFGDSFTSIVTSLEELHSMDRDCMCETDCGDDCKCK